MSSHISLCGSQREHPAGSVALGKPAPDEIIQLTLVLRRRGIAPDPASIASHLSHAQLADLHGADPADVESVEAFASEQGFMVVRLNSAARSVTISGPFEAMAVAFGADVELRGVQDQILRTRQGQLTLPESLAGRVVAVLGFDQRPAARTHHQFIPAASLPVAYTPVQVAQAYDFPTNTGKNQTIGLIELGGGFRNSDLQKFWKQLNIKDVAVSAVSVDGGQNSPVGDPDSADGEVGLDIEVAGEWRQVRALPRTLQTIPIKASSRPSTLPFTIKNASLPSSPSVGEQVRMSGRNKRWMHSTRRSTMRLYSVFRSALLLAIMVRPTVNQMTRITSTSLPRVHGFWPAVAPVCRLRTAKSNRKQFGTMALMAEQRAAA